MRTLKKLQVPYRRGFIERSIVGRGVALDRFEAGGEPGTTDACNYNPCEHGFIDCPDIAYNVMLTLDAGDIKTYGDEPGWPRTNATDGDESLSSHWSGFPLDAGVANAWFAADVGVVDGVKDGYRILTDTSSSDTPQNVATEVRVYCTNDSSKWSALTHASGYMTDDPEDDLGWTLVDTYTTSLSGVSDSGLRSFADRTERYWLFKAISGGTSEWDVNEFELWVTAPGEDCFVVYQDGSYLQLGEEISPSSSILAHLTASGSSYDTYMIPTLATDVSNVWIDQIPTDVWVFSPETNIITFPLELEPETIVMARYITV